MHVLNQRRVYKMPFYIKYFVYIVVIFQLIFTCLVSEAKKAKSSMDWEVKVEYDLRPLKLHTSLDSVMKTIKEGRQPKTRLQKMKILHDKLLMSHIKQSTANLDGYNQSFAQMIDVNVLH